MNEESSCDISDLTLDRHRMNRIIRHRLRNLCAGVKMAVVRIAEQTSETHPQIGDRCSIIVSELDSLETFSSRMDLIFDPLPVPEPLTLTELISLLRAFFVQKFPFSTLLIEGEEGNSSCIHGSWGLVVLKELLTNAGEAAGFDHDVTLGWNLAEKTISITVKNSGEPIPSEIPVNPPQPFFTVKSRHDGLGLAIAERICRAMDSTLIINSELENLVSVTMELKVNLKNANG